MRDPEVVAVLVKIVQRYDILLVQEIRDVSQESFPQLVEEVNSHFDSPMFKFIVSERLGRSTSKEQYGFIYRVDKVEILSTYQYLDADDIFERDPFNIQVRRLDHCYSGPRDLNIVGVHTKPSDAKEEINGLVDVYDHVAEVFGEDVIIAGDFNADCRYVCKSCWDKIKLWTDNRFKWLLGNDIDSTVSSTDCAYDRIVAAGSNLVDNVDKGKVFRFDLAYDLNHDLTEDVSDHYPVEIILK